MSTLAARRVEQRRCDGEQTLDDLLARAWEELQAHRVVECPVCHGEMEPDRGAQGRPIGGRCSACGSTLR